MTTFDKIWNSIEAILGDMEALTDVPPLDMEAMKAEIALDTQDYEVAVDAALGLLVLVAASYGAAIGPVAVAMGLIEAMQNLADSQEMRP